MSNDKDPACPKRKCMQFNKHQQKLIGEYKKLLLFGYNKISTIELDLKKVRVRKEVLYFMMGAMQSYSESILKIAGSIPIYEKSAEVLLRSQIELLLNIRYIYSKRSEENARLFLSDLLLESVDFAKRHRRLWNKYPKWNLVFGSIKKACDWDKFIMKNLHDLKLYRQKYGDKDVGKMPSLYDRIIAIDKHLKSLGKLKENNSAEKYYTYYYKYFSQTTHLSMSGLQRFMRGTGPNTEPFLDIDSKPEDAERVLTVSYQVYLTVVRIFLQIFDCYEGKEFKPFLQYSKKILKHSGNISK